MFKLGRFAMPSGIYSRILSTKRLKRELVNIVGYPWSVVSFAIGLALSNIERSQIHRRERPSHRRDGDMMLKTTPAVTASATGFSGSRESLSGQMSSELPLALGRSF